MTATPFARLELKRSSLSAARTRPRQPNNLPFLQKPHHGRRIEAQTGALALGVSLAAQGSDEQGFDRGVELELTVVLLPIFSNPTSFAGVTQPLVSSAKSSYDHLCRPLSHALAGALGAVFSNASVPPPASSSSPA